MLGVWHIIHPLKILRTLHYKEKFESVCYELILEKNREKK